MLSAIHSAESDLTAVMNATPVPYDLVTAFRACLAAVERSQPILLIAPPGVGKVMIARRVHATLGAWDDPTERFEANLLFWSARLLDVLTVDNDPKRGRSYSYHYGQACLSATSEDGLPSRPFRAPHHTVSETGLFGGGSGVLRPGEVSLAHGGTLLLDEIAEFRSRDLDRLARVLRNGVSDFYVNRQTVPIPARPRAIIATSNPCACGRIPCSCSPMLRERHAARLAALAATFPAVIEVRPFVQRTHVTGNGFDFIVERSREGARVLDAHGGADWLTRATFTTFDDACAAANTYVAGKRS